MTLSMPGLIGAAVGLICALIAYVAIMPQLKRSEAAGGAAPNVAAIRMILMADFVVLAAVGYFIGQMFD